MDTEIESRYSKWFNPPAVQNILFAFGSIQIFVQKFS